MEERNRHLNKIVLFSPLLLTASKSYQLHLLPLWAGIPIEIALRFIISISATRLNEVIDPTKNIALNAVVFGTNEITPSDVVTSDVYKPKKSPAITGPIAPPIILIVPVSGCNNGCGIRRSEVDDNIGRQSHKSPTNCEQNKQECNLG